MNTRRAFKAAGLWAFALLVSLTACSGVPTAGSDTAPSAAVSEVQTQAPETTAVAFEAETEETAASAETEAAETTSAAESGGPALEYEPPRPDTDTLTWDFAADTGTLSLHGEGPMRGYADEEPEWAQYKEEILAVTLDEGITSVGICAFGDLPHLAEVCLPDSVEVIDDSAFYYDWELRTITIPASLRYVGRYAFYNTLLWEPENLIFPEGCVYIGDLAFHSALKSGGTVSLPSTLRYLGRQAFTNALISDFTVAEDNTVYRSENHAIYSKDGKKLLMLAPLAADTAEFRIPDGVESISAECFNLIQNITRVTIPASVTSIEEGTFFSTFALKEIIVDEANPAYRSENGLLLSKDGTLLHAWPDGIEAWELVIPDGVERLGEHLFYGRNDGSYTVVLPESVKQLGTLCLPQAMTSINLPAGLERIDAYVFGSGLSVEKITYGGTAENWAEITVGDGNTALDSANIAMK